jgi:hypothetical protein
MFSFQMLFLTVLIVLTSYAGPAAARHPHGDEESDAIIRLLEQADDHLARTRDVLRKSPELGAAGSPVRQVHQSIERTLEDVRALRTAIHVAFEEPEIHENAQALKPVQKVARELARMSVALRTMATETVEVAKRAK